MSQPTARLVVLVPNPTPISNTPVKTRPPTVVANVYTPLGPYCTVSSQSFSALWEVAPVHPILPT